MHGPFVAQFNFEKYKTNFLKLAIWNKLVKHVTIIIHKYSIETDNKNNNDHCQQQCLAFVEIRLGTM